MKKIICVFIAALFMFTGCTKKEKLTEPIMPNDILSLEQAIETIGADYTMKLQYGAIVDMGDNTFQATYLSEPVGEHDAVYISVMSPNEQLTESTIKDKYNEEWSKRKNKKKVQGIGDSAYIAFPSINIYESGYYIKITAGSGNTEEQLDLLVSLGKLSVENLQNKLNPKKK